MTSNRVPRKKADDDDESYESRTTTYHPTEIKRGVSTASRSMQRGRGSGMFGRGGCRGGHLSSGSNTVPVADVDKPGNIADDKKQDRSSKPDRPNRSNRLPRKEKRDLTPKDTIVRPTWGNPREVDEIFKDDDISKKLYATAYNQDDEIKVDNDDKPANFEFWKDIPDLNQKLMENIQRAGYTRPRNIQAFTIPYILEGCDVIAQAETGSGKSAAFLIPLIQMVSKKNSKKNASKEKYDADHPFVLIIEPTRELALQIYDQARKFASGTNVRIVKAYGEYPYNANAAEIYDGADIVVGTPGRILHFLSDCVLSVGLLECLVLDEADRLLDDRFGKDIDKIVNFIRNFTNADEVHQLQVLLFSATFPDHLESFGRNVLKSNYKVIRNERASMPNIRIKQTLEDCTNQDKKIMMYDYCKNILDEAEKANGIKKAKMETEEEKDDGKSTDQSKFLQQPRILIFTSTKAKSDAFAFYLNNRGMKCLSLNSDRPQKLRERALDLLRRGEINVLVATDCCARGLDIRELNHVLNFDMPFSITTYIQRIGRTGRLEQGYAHSFFDTVADKDLARDMIRLLQADNLEVPEFLLKATRFHNEARVVEPPRRFGTKDTVEESPEIVEDSPEFSSEEDSSEVGFNFNTFTQ
ncbi:hypothetical protein M3Y98_00652300 [Aphelenchoides besseyi]|nr:hypothetical protein M3Y98_00652300 [Aphelenchoides besseyi]